MAARVVGGWEMPVTIPGQDRRVTTNVDRPRNEVFIPTGPPPADQPTIDSFDGANPGNVLALLGFDAAEANRRLAPLGLTADDLIAAGEAAAPHLIQAAQALANGDREEAIDQLRQAQRSAAPVTAKAIAAAAARHLPNSGPMAALRSVLADPAAVSMVLTDVRFQDGAIALIEGRTEEGIEGILESRTARDMIGRAAKALPRSDETAVLRALLTNAAVVRNLTGDDVRQAVTRIFTGDPSGGLADLIENETLRRDAVTALAGDPAVVDLARRGVLAAGGKALLDAMDSLGLTPGDVVSVADAVPQLVEAGQAFQRGDAQRGWQLVKEGVRTASPVLVKSVNALAKKIPDGPDAPLLRSLLGDPAFVSQVVTDGQLEEAVADFAAGRVDAGLEKLLANDELRQTAVRAATASPEARAILEKMGISSEGVVAIADTAPDLVEAAKAFQRGDTAAGWDLVLRAVRTGSPALVEGINQLADRIPPGPGSHFIKALLSDDYFVGKVIEDPKLEQAIRDFAAGRVSQGVERLLHDNELLQAGLDAISKSPEVRESLGGVDAEDIRLMGRLAPTAIELAEDLRAGRHREAIEDLLSLVDKVPAESWARLAGGILKKLDLPGDLGKLIGSGIDIFTDPEVLKALLSSVDALALQNVGGFFAGLAKAGQLAVEREPQASVMFMDALANLPGSAGKLFKDHGLNEAVIRTGAAKHVYAALQRMAEGRFPEVVGELQHAAGLLVTNGGGVVNEQGLFHVVKLCERFFDALPDPIKRKVEVMVAKALAEAGVGAIPVVGDIVSTVLDGIDLYNTMTNPEADEIDKLLSGASLALDVVGFFQVTKPAQIPVKAAIEVLQFVKLGKGLVDTFGDFTDLQRGLAGFAPSETEAQRIYGGQPALPPTLRIPEIPPGIHLGNGTRTWP
jgi:hypothetical protein